MVDVTHQLITGEGSKNEMRYHTSKFMFQIVKIRRSFHQVLVAAIPHPKAQELSGRPGASGHRPIQGHFIILVIWNGLHQG